MQSRIVKNIILITLNLNTGALKRCRLSSTCSIASHTYECSTPATRPNSWWKQDNWANQSQWWEGRRWRNWQSGATITICCWLSTKRMSAQKIWDDRPTHFSIRQWKLLKISGYVVKHNPQEVVQFLEHGSA